MKDVGLYVFGTSILWGQGHDDAKKIHSLIQDRLEVGNHGTVRLHHRAHSGAVLKGRPRRGGGELHGEVPDPWPSISTQIDSTPEATEKRTLVLIDGGINDVDVFNIINPFYPRAKLIRRTKQHCYRDLLDVLLKIVRKYPGADTYVLGYYSILASRVRKAELASLLLTMRICEAGDLRAAGLVSKALGNCRAFWRESDRQIAWAARAADTRAAARSGSVTFVPSGFEAKSGLFGRRALLFGLGQVDSQFDDRFIPCTRAIIRGRSGIHCQFAATGHPNRSGVRRYVKSLKAQMGI